MTRVRRVALTAFLGCTIAGCSGPAGDRVATEAPSGAERVVLAVAHESRWRELWIEGTTDLPDGAVVSYRVTHALANELPPSEWPVQNLIADGTAVVRELFG